MKTLVTSTALREELQVSHKSLAKWLDMLERLHAIFRLPPFGAPRLRAVRKERKHYHFDWSLVPDMPRRFENLVASNLLKWVDYETDARGRDLELRYFRDVDGREVDFVVLEDRKPMRFIECKWADGEVSKGFKYLKAKFPAVESWQIAATGKSDFISPEGIRVSPAVPFLRGLA